MDSIPMHRCVLYSCTSIMKVFWSYFDSYAKRLNYYDTCISDPSQPTPLYLFIICTYHRIVDDLHKVRSICYITWIIPCNLFHITERPREFKLNIQKSQLKWVYWTSDMTQSFRRHGPLFYKQFNPHQDTDWVVEQVINCLMKSSGNKTRFWRDF